MNKISHEDWLQLIQLTNNEIDIHPYIRFGQALYNMAYTLYPELIRSLNNSDADPFHTGKEENSLSVCLFYDAIVENN